MSRPDKEIRRPTNRIHELIQSYFNAPRGWTWPRRIESTSLLPSPFSRLPSPHRNTDKDPIFPVMAAAKLCFQRPLDSLRRKLKKPLFKGDNDMARERRRHRRGAGWWWKSALLFRKQSHEGGESRTARLWPLYVTESNGGGRGARRPKAAMLLAVAEVGSKAAAGVAYQRLRDASGDHQAAAAATPPPIYIVT